MEFTVKSTIKATAKELYQAWLNSQGHTAMTGGHAEISDKVGDSFTAWDEYIEGKNLALEPFKRIVQSWRTTEFDLDDEDSVIEVHFNESNGATEITLIHSNLPETGGHYEQGWIDHYFQPMKAFFE